MLNLPVTMTQETILSKTEEEVLKLLQEKGYTPRKAAIIRGVSTQAIYRIRKELIKKGLLPRNNNNVGFSDRGTQHNDKKEDWRLHALEFSVRILHGHTGDTYLRARAGGDKLAVVSLPDASVLLYRDKLRVVITRSFVSASPSQAFLSANAFLFRVLSRLEYDLRVVLVKPRVSNIHLLKGECAHMGDEMAVRSKDASLRVVDVGDGKPRWRIDFSDGLPELESLHPQKQVDDAEMYKRFLSDLSHNPHLPLSEVSSLSVANARQLGELAQALRVTVEAQNSLLKLISSFFPRNSSSFDEREENKVFPDYVG